MPVVRTAELEPGYRSGVRVLRIVRAGDCRRGLQIKKSVPGVTKRAHAGCAVWPVRNRSQRKRENRWPMRYRVILQGTGGCGRGHEKGRGV